MRRFRYLIAVVLFVSFGYLLYSAYAEVKRNTISEFNAQQMILAKQAANGIEHYFQHCYRDLTYLSQLEEIVSFNADGMLVMQTFIETHSDVYTAITRTDENGIILHTVPYNPQSIGADISYQEHVQQLLATHQPVVSEVFEAVQGYQAVAYHVPVFNQGEFAGSIALLIPFDLLAQEYLENIQPGDSGYAWVISQQGVEIHCPIPNHIGKSISETTLGYESLLAMANQMMAGMEGTTAYRYYDPGYSSSKLISKHAAFCPIKLGNTFWSIAVTTPERDVLATMTGFRNRFFFILVLLMGVSLVYAYFFVKSWAVLREEQYRKQAEKEKAELAEQYQQAQKMEAVGRLAAGVAHDLNNLLTPVLGYSEIIIEDLEEDDTRLLMMMKEIERASLRARDLVQQLLAFGRKQPLEAAPVSLNDIIAGLEPLLRRTIRESIEIQMNLKAGDPVILADAGQLEQVVMNLAINAQDAMPSGGRIEIITEDISLEKPLEAKFHELKPGRYAKLALRDTGHGMDAATRERLFEPFFTTKERGQGTGLGLSTAHGIVTQHGGTILVQSEQGEGTAFEIYFPITTDRSVAKSERSIQAVSTKGTEVVFVAEDNAMVRNLAVSVLNRQGYSALSAPNGAECLMRIAELQGELNLLLTDVVMPDMNGKELYGKVRELYPRVKVLYMSGYTDNVISHHGMLDEGVPFIQKPFSVSSLSNKVREVLDAAGN